MKILPSIELAASLDSQAKEALTELLNVYKNVNVRNESLRKYYESDFVPKDIGIDVLPHDVSVEANCDWPRKAVTSVAERCHFDGFVFNNSYTDQNLDNAIENNAFKSAFNLHIPSELIHGCMFGTVGRFNDKVQLRFHTAETAAGIWNMAEGRLECGFVIAQKKKMPWSSKPEVTQVNLHMPGRVVVIERTDVARWRAKSDQTPLDRPMMEAFAFRPTGLKPFGQTRITKTVKSIADDVVRTMQYMAISSAFFAAPQKYLLGITDDQYDAISQSKWSTYIGNLLLATVDENGNAPKFGQLSPASPQPYIDILRTYAQMFSGATGVPLNSLGIVQDNPSSAEAINAAREDIIIAAQDLIESNKPGLKNMALMAMAVAENKTIDELTDDQKSVTAHFSDPSKPSIVSQADAIVKIASVAPWIAESEVFLEYLGFEDADKKRLLQDKAKVNAQNMLAEKLTFEKEQSEQQAQIAGKSLNGSQLQGLIAIISQYSGGKITEGQAVRLISTSFGMSIEDARDILNGQLGEVING